MAVLSSGLMVVVAGVQASTTLAVSSGTKIRVSMDSTVFPLGTTTIGIGISTDGGSTFQVASMGCPGSKSGNWVMTYELGPDDVPTHTKVMIDAAIGFSASMTVEAL